VKLNIQPATPPEKVFTDRGGSKYDEAITIALSNPNQWFQVASVPVEKRDSMYSTASAIRKGRLGNIPEGKRLDIMCRRVDNDIIMFIRGC